MPTYEARIKVLLEAGSFQEAEDLAETVTIRINADLQYRWDDGRVRDAELTHLGVRSGRKEWPADFNEGSSFDWERAQRVVFPKLRRSEFDDS